MFRDKAFRLGTITRTHGISGQLKLVCDIMISEPDEWPEWVFLDIDGGLVPFRTVPEGIIYRDETDIILSLEDYYDQEKSLKLVGYDLWFPEEFRSLTEKHESTIPPIIGYILEDSEGREIGVIDDFIDLPENPLFHVMFHEKEILIPARAEWIVDVDGDARRIIMDLPDGLLDI